MWQPGKGSQEVLEKGRQPIYINTQSPSDKGEVSKLAAQSYESTIVLPLFRFLLPQDIP